MRKIHLLLSITLIILLLTLTTNAQKSKSTTKKTTTINKPIAKGSLSFEAGLTFKSGDVKPVARATFYLLKENTEKIVLTQQNLDIYNQELTKVSGIKPETLAEWSLYGAVVWMDGKYTPDYATTVKNALETNMIALATTGFDGKGVFESVPIGDYFLFGYYKVGSQTTYWNIPVSIKTGANKLILDNNNMR